MSKELWMHKLHLAKELMLEVNTTPGKYIVNHSRHHLTNYLAHGEYSRMCNLVQLKSVNKAKMNLKNYIQDFSTNS